MDNRITQEQLQRIFVYDSVSGWLIWKQPKSFRVTIGDKAGTIRPDGYVVVTLFGIKWLAHHLIWCYVYGDLPEEDTDHIDRNPNNNRLNNLRVVGNAINRRNMRKRRDNQSGYTGVRNNHGKWQAYITHQSKFKSLGNFNSKEEAAKCRQTFLQNNPKLGFTNRHGE